LNRIYQRDCLEGMAMIPNKSVDLIVIDPPYNIGKDKRWDKWNTVEDYVNWMADVFKECERVLKPTGSFYWFHNDMTQIRKLMDSLDGTSFIFKQLITWNKIDPAFRNYGYVQQRLSIDMMRNYYNGFTEYCAYYTFQEELTDVTHDVKKFAELRNYFSEFLSALGISKKSVMEKVGQRADHCFRSNSSQWDLPTAETYASLSELVRDDSFHYRTYESLRKDYESLREDYESQRYTFNVASVKETLRANSNVWLYPPAKNLGHITPKPVELIESIIRHSSNEGDVVLDCFMGSGTTAVAATRLNRNFIGFERESEYVRIANQRLEAMQDEMAERKLTEE
jgi:DNA modification methylase